LSPGRYLSCEHDVYFFNTWRATLPQFLPEFTGPGAPIPRVPAPLNSFLGLGTRCFQTIAPDWFDPSWFTLPPYRLFVFPLARAVSPFFFQVLLPFFQIYAQDSVGLCAWLSITADPPFPLSWPFTHSQFLSLFLSFAFLDFSRRWTYWTQFAGSLVILCVPKYSLQRPPNLHFLMSPVL